MKIISLLFTLVCVTASAFAACIGSPNCTVKAAGGGNYTTIQACASAAVAGDTCKVFAGTYNEVPTLSVSGTGSAGICTACITFTVNPGDTVTTYPWDIAADYVIVTGFTITDTNALTSLVFNCNGLTPCHAGIYIHAGHTGVKILNNTITQVGYAASGGTASGYPCISMQDGASHYVTIKGNTLSWCSALSSEMNQAANCAANQGNCHMATGIVWLGDHILVQNNNISHFTNCSSLGGGTTNSAFIGNTCGPTYPGTVDQTAQSGAPPEHDSLGCVEANGCDTHVDSVEAASGGNNQILIEGNTLTKIWGTAGAHMWFASVPNASSSTNWISRFNAGYQIGSAFLANDTGTSNPNGVAFWKDYNNDYVNSEQQSTSQAFAVCGPGAQMNNSSLLNDLFYNSINPAGTAAAAYYNFNGASCQTNLSSGHNLAFDSSCSPGTLAHCTSGLMNTDSGNIFADPKLIATDGSNFHLQSGSPAIAAGTNLTTASGAGTSSTSLTVADAAYFQDGWGIPGVNADWIRIGASTTVQISSINYSTNVITLASAVSWNNLDPIYLYKDSQGNVVLNSGNPDIGALPFSNQTSVPEAPSPHFSVIARKMPPIRSRCKPEAICMVTP